jgi:hypothetical protein
MCTHAHTSNNHRASRTRLQGRHRNLFRFLFHLSGVQCLLTLLSSHENIHNLNHNIPQSTANTTHETPNIPPPLSTNWCHQLTDEIIGVTFETREMLRGSTFIHSTFYSHLVLKRTNTTTGLGVWTDKLGYSCVYTQLNTFHPSHKQSKQLYTEEQLSLLNKILQNIKHPARSSADEDSSLV